MRESLPGIHINFGMGGLLQQKLKKTKEQNSAVVSDNTNNEEWNKYFLIGHKTNKGAKEIYSHSK